MAGHSTLRRRILVLVVALLGLLVLLSAAVTDTILRRNAAMDETTAVIEPAREALVRLLGGLVDQSTALRGYLLSRDPAFLDSYRSGAEAVERQRTTLARLLGDEDALGPLHAAVTDAVARWNRDVAEPELELAAAGRWEEATAMVAARVGEQRLTEARSAIADLRGALVARQAELSAAAADARSRLTALVAATLAGGFVLVAAIGWLLQRWLTTPLDRVTKAAAAVAAGRLRQTVPVSGPSDIAALACAVEGMRATIVGLLDDAVRARQALEQQGQAVLLFRRELAASRAQLPAGVSAAGHLRPTEGILAGDWYDVVPGDDGSVTALVVDVAGHGTRAGVLALRAKHLLEAAVRRGLAPGEALTWLAAGMAADDEDFLTAIVATVHPDTGTCRYANAGHPPGLVVGPRGRSRWVEPTGPLIGPMPARWATEELTVHADDVLLLYTDGIVDARDRDGEPFGTERLIGVAEAAAGQGPAALVQACIDAVSEFTAGHLTDDLTAVALNPGEGRAGAPQTSGYLHATTG